MPSIAGIVSLFGNYEGCPIKIDQSRLSQPLDCVSEHVRYQTNKQHLRDQKKNSFEKRLIFVGDAYER